MKPFCEWSSRDIAAHTYGLRGPYPEMDMEKMSMEDKVERNGKVAVLVSPGYGAGWSTWCSDDQKHTAMFDPRLVAAAEAGVSDIEPLVKEIFGENYFYVGGWRDIQICWVPKGWKFAIQEYDGSEDLMFVSDLSIEA